MNTRMLIWLPRGSFEIVSPVAMPPGEFWSDPHLSVLSLSLQLPACDISIDSIGSDDMVTSVLVSELRGLR